MATAATENNEPGSRIPMDHKLHPSTTIGFFLVLLARIAFAGYSIFIDAQHVGETLALRPFGVLGLALLIALGSDSSTASTIPPTPSPPSSTPLAQAGGRGGLVGLLELHRRADLT